MAKKLLVAVVLLAPAVLVFVEPDSPANDADGEGRSVTSVLSGGYARYGASTTVPADAEIDASIEMQRPAGTPWMPKDAAGSRTDRETSVVATVP